MDELESVDWKNVLRNSIYFVKDHEEERVFSLLIRCSLTSDEEPLRYLKEQLIKRSAEYDPASAINEESSSMSGIGVDWRYHYNLVDVCALALTAKPLLLVFVDRIELFSNPPKYVLFLKERLIGFPATPQELSCPLPRYIPPLELLGCRKDWYYPYIFPKTFALYDDFCWFLQNLLNQNKA